MRGLQLTHELWEMTNTYTLLVGKP